MAALLKLRLLLAISAICLATAGAPAVADNGPNSKGQSTSRIAPKSDNSVAFTSSSAVETEDQLLVSRDQLALVAEACVQVFGDDGIPKPETLVRNGWAYSQPVRTTNFYGSYEKVEYSKRGFTLQLQDFGNYVICSGGAFIEGPYDMATLQADLGRSLGATKFAETKGFEKIIMPPKGGKPPPSFENTMILGPNLLELAIIESNLGKLGLKDAKEVVFVKISASPLPPSLKKLQQNSSSE